jgi:CubicO group peptidase (beta-lactamase class C family)
MEADAYWQLTEPAGGEFGGCCINATLRDYGRLGMFALADGVLADGTRVLPQGWMAASTKPSQGYDGYGYFWWLNPDDTYSASGIFGQGIYIAPEKNLVIAVHSAWEHAGRGEDFDRLQRVYDAIAAGL